MKLWKCDNCDTVKAKNSRPTSCNNCDSSQLPSTASDFEEVKPEGLE